MKYFTKEELEDITRNLLEEPSRETLKKLNEKYNGSDDIINHMVNKVSNESLDTKVVEPIHAKLEEETFIKPISQVEEPQVVTPIPNFNIPTNEIPKIENLNNNTQKFQSFELPKLETPIFNNSNNTPVNFSGNLFDKPKPEVENLMQTTDNFSTIPNTMPTSEVPITNYPFFEPSTGSVNNQVPVNEAPTQRPTMFGQLEQNYM